jgi:hypothetical protein
MRLAGFLVVAFLAFGSCKSQCRQLSERMCECSLNTNEKQACLGRAANAEGANPPSYEQEETCRNAIYGSNGKAPCDCRLIDTPEGKIRCGLARDPNASPTGDAGS